MTNKKPVLFWIWLMMLVAYLDRVNISVAGPTMMAALHMSKAVFGWVSSSFQFGYALLQIPGGYLADRFGARVILVTALAIWSVFTALTGTARSVGSLVGIRVLFGAGEGIENGAQFKLIGDYFDSKERSSANALFLTALALGPALAAPISAWVIRQFGWRELFYSFAMIGLVVAALLYVFLPKPPEGAAIDAAPVDRSAQRAEWRAVMSQTPTWLAFAAYLFFNIAFWGYLTWMPSYLSLARHITLKDLGTLASIPYLCGFVGMVALGQLGSHAMLRWRAGMIAVSYLLAGFFLFITYSASSVAECVVGLSLAAFFLYGGFGPFWAIALDLTPADKRGAFSGFVNFGGQIGGFIAPAAVGELVTATNSFTAGFLFMIGGLVVSSVCLIWLQGKAGRNLTRPSGSLP